MDQLPGGPDWMKISPVAGSLFHEKEQLRFYSAEDPVGVQGFRDILVTESVHPYMNAWWPPGHIIGYEHTFVNAMADFLKAIGSGTQVAPNFVDGVKEMEILDAALESARTGRTVEVTRKAVG